MSTVTPHDSAYYYTTPAQSRTTPIQNIIATLVTQASGITEMSHISDYTVRENEEMGRE